MTNDHSSDASWTGNLLTNELNLDMFKLIWKTGKDDAIYFLTLHGFDTTLFNITDELVTMLSPLGIEFDINEYSDDIDVEYSSLTPDIEVETDSLEQAEIDDQIAEIGEKGFPNSVVYNVTVYNKANLVASICCMEQQDYQLVAKYVCLRKLLI